MSKGHKKQKQKTETKSSNQIQFKIQNFHLDIAFPILLILMLAFLMKPMLIDGLTPQGVDVVASLGSSNQIKQYEQETGEKALWNPYQFSGMPRYHRHGPVAFSVDSILNVLGKLFNNIFIYYQAKVAI